MRETLYAGRRVRLLTVIDEGNRQGLEIAMGLSPPSRRVIRVLDELVAVHGCPPAVRVDNAEFTAQTFGRLVHGERRGDSRHPARQARSEGLQAYIERFNRSYRTEVLNAHLFESVAELQALTAIWLRICNGERPHGQPRPGAAAHVSAGAFVSRRVSLRAVYLTGKFTGGTGRQTGKETRPLLAREPS